MSLVWQWLGLGLAARRTLGLSSGLASPDQRCLLGSSLPAGLWLLFRLLEADSG